MRAFRRLHSLLRSSSVRQFAIAAHAAPPVPALAVAASARPGASRGGVGGSRATAAAASPSPVPSPSPLGALARRVRALRVSPGLERHPARHLRAASTRVATRTRAASRDPSPAHEGSAYEPDDGVYGSSHKRPMGKSRSGDAFVTQGLGSRAYLRVIGLGTDTDGAEAAPSVLLFTDAKRYTFNVGEGFQRFAVEHGVNVRRLSHVFLTRVCGRTAGGLVGMLLTVADDTYPQNQNFDDGESETKAPPTLHVHGPPRTERLMSAVDALVGGRGVRTVRRPFPLMPSQMGESKSESTRGWTPALDDGIVTVTPVVVAPNPIGPLGPLNASSVPPPAKRTKGVFGAFTFGADASVPAEEAESVCYHVQLCGMPGKFDPVKAEALGVPRGKMRGQLVRGEDVTLDDGRVVKSSDVVGEAQRGARFIVVDCPTTTHLRELSDSKSSAGAALAKLAEGDGTPEGAEKVGDLACVVHLAPADVASSEEYRRWMETCEAFKNSSRPNSSGPAVRHLLVNQRETKGAPVFRSAARVNARLHLVDPTCFPEPARGRAEDVAEAEAAVKEATERARRVITGTNDAFAANVFAGINGASYTLWPRHKVGLDLANAPVQETNEAMRADLDRAALERSVAAAEAARIAEIAKFTGNGADADAELDVPPGLAAMNEGDAEIIFLGTGSSAPAKYRNVTGIVVDQKDKGSVFVDTGEGTLGQLVRCVGVDAADDIVRRLKCVWISHIHADHHVGLPTILARRRALLGSNRSNADPVTVVGPKDLRRFLNAYNAVEPLHARFVDCRATLEGEWTRGKEEEREGVVGTTNAPNSPSVDGLINKPGSSSFDWGDSLSHVRDACAALGLRRMVSTPVVHCAHAFALTMESEATCAETGEGWKLVYSGDTRPCSNVTDAARGATVLVHEATFEDGMEEDAVKKRHSTVGEAVKVGVDAGAYRTVLTHFSQRYPKVPVFKGGQRVGVAFDLMRLDFKTGLPRVPSFLEAARSLFPEEEDAETPAKEPAP